MKDGFDRHIYRILLATVIFLVTAGTYLFHVIEKLSWLDAYYFCVVTLATVGYGDITPKTPAGKILDTIYIFLGVGIITTFFSYRLKKRADKYEERHNRKGK
jgi:voltage-gated potassium channel